MIYNYPIMKWMDSIKRGLKRHAHHVIFGVSILSLALLATWWSVFINRSIEERRVLYKQNLESTLVLLSWHLGRDKNNPPNPGIFKADDRFEIIPCRTGTLQFSRPLLPHWPLLCLRVREPELKSIEEDFKQKKVMVIGESSLLVLIIFLGSILLYKFIQLERRSAREVEEFWGRVTHEIKTPITGIKAFLQSLKNQSLDPVQLPQFVDMALNQVEKQEQLAENILAGCGLRYPKNDHTPHMEDLNINECIQAYFDSHMILLTDAELSFHLNKASPMVRADYHILRLILDNIVENALKYCSPGLLLTVRVLLQQKNKKAIIAIQDNGPGFKPEFSQRIFEAYRCLAGELPGISHMHGSGMGLYISRQLAEKMGGYLEASSSGEGQGAEFRLFLNLAKEQKY
jgi:signal transduction histidine kinase